MTALPPEIKFGKVVGRWALAVADTAADPDEHPDISFPTGKVTFKRLDVNTVLLDTLQNDGTFIGIARKDVEAELGPDGELRLAGKSVGGVWLAVGSWQVTPVIADSNWTAFPIVVEETHTALAPLDLLAWSPIVETPTVVLVASIETALRAEAAADRAEAAADRAEGAELTYDSLDDVDTTGLADGDAMVWDQASGKWVRVSPSSTYAAKAADLGGDFTSNAATVGQAPLADGAGGVAWGDPGVATALWLPGLGTDYVAAPDAANLDILGDLDVRVKVAPASWQTTYYLASKGGSCWYFRINSNNTLAVYNYGTGARLATSGAVSGLVDGVPMWLRFTWDVDNGAGGNTVRFYKSTDGAAWEQVGSNSTAAGVAAFPNTTGALVLGLFTIGSPSNPFTGLYYCAEVRDGIDGTVAARWDGRAPSARQRDSAGNIWTVNGTANAWQVVSA